MLRICSLLISLSFLPFVVSIFQQAHYSIKGYFNYFTRHFYLELLFILMNLVYFINCYLGISLAFLFSIYLIILFCKLRLKLKLTKRIYRLLLIIMPFVLIGSYLCLNYLLIYLLIIPFFISKLLETKINNYYLHKAMKKRDEFKGDVIAITGSFGKTTTKYFTSQILESLLVLPTNASYNTLNGISLTFNENNINYFNSLILEFGSNHLNDISLLCKSFKPTISIVTGIGPMHLDSFKTIDNIIKEKMSITNELHSNEIAILNYDNEYIKNYKYDSKAYIISYGKAADFSYKIRDDKIKIFAYGVFLFEFNQNNYDDIDVSNMMPGIILGILNKIKNEELIYRLEHIKRPSYRQFIYEINDCILIDDSFNSNLVGALKALDILKQYDKKKIIITPGFVECKDVLEDLYKKYAKKINEICDYAYIVKLDTSKSLFDLITINHSYVKSVDDARRRIKWKSEAILIENDVPDIYL